MVFLNFNVCCLLKRDKKKGKNTKPTFSTYKPVIHLKIFFGEEKKYAPYRGRVQCIIINFEINVYFRSYGKLMLFICSNAIMQDCDSLLLSYISSRSVALTHTHTHTQSLQFCCAWIISVPTSFSPFVFYAQLPYYDPSMSSFSV